MKKTKKTLLILLMIAAIGMTTFSALQYFYKKSTSEQTLVKKKAELKELEAQLATEKEINYQANSQLKTLKKEETAALEEKNQLDSKINDDTEQYLVKGKNAADLLATIKEKITQLPLPEGKVLKEKDGKFILEVDPLYKKSEDIAKMTKADVKEIYKTLKEKKLPFKDGNWPLEIIVEKKTYAIGSKEYDEALGTNFSGKNSSGAYANAKKTAPVEKTSTTTTTSGTDKK